MCLRSVIECYCAQMFDKTILMYSENFLITLTNKSVKFLDVHTSCASLKSNSIVVSSTFSFIKDALAFHNSYCIQYEIFRNI